MKPQKLLLIGIGEVFEFIEDDPGSFGLAESELIKHKFENVDQVSALAGNVLKNFDPKEVTLFVSLDSNALNHARLEVYGRARLFGFSMANLIHHSAILSPSVQLADNIYIGPYVQIGPSSEIAGNSFLCASSRLGASVKISSHCWLGAGVTVGSGSTIASHVVLGDNTQIDKQTELEHHVLIEKSGPWSGKWTAGTFLEKHSTNPAITVGPSYTYSRMLKK